MRSVLPEDGKAEGPKGERPLQVEALPRLHVVDPHKDGQQVDQSYGKGDCPGGQKAQGMGSWVGAA